MDQPNYIGSDAHLVDVLRRVDRAIERESPFLSVAEVASRIGSTEQTVRNMIRDGRLKGVSTGKRGSRCIFRVRQIELEKLMEPGAGTVADDVQI